MNQLFSRIKPQALKTNHIALVDKNNHKFSLLSWFILALLSIFLSWYYLFIATFQQGGDIAEYYGITQTLITEQTLSLSKEQESILKEYLHAAYFENPGYYISGRSDDRYPVHFFAYSMLAVPIRIVLELIAIEPYKTLWIMNVISFLTAISFIWYRYLGSFKERISFLCLAFLSPLMSFFAWPGPDLWYLSLLLITPFAFIKKEFRLATFTVIIASWHSQPLIILAVLIAAYDCIQLMNWKVQRQRQIISFDLRRVIEYLIIGTLGLIPYAYNIYAFNNLTPWTILEDGWTLLHGFGPHNMSVIKSFEQVFDLNIGQFWYAPWLFIFSIWAFIESILKRNIQINILVLFFIITAVFYQTNPAWHYGTSGYGPGRHGLLYLPLVITLTTLVITQWRKKIAVPILAIVLGTHFFILSFNNFLEPDLTKTLHHSVFARYVLNRKPNFYNPTPEIFVDRTNNDDASLPTSAIYINEQGDCLKAWILYSETEILEAICGKDVVNNEYELKDEFSRISNYQRSVITTEATFWPHPYACADWFEMNDQQPFVCLDTVQKVMEQTGIDDSARIVTVPNFPYTGIWRIESGKPTELKIPAGYQIDYRSVEGIYVDFTK